MPKTIPDYLRLHPGPQAHRAPSPPVTVDPLSRFWQAYTTATGWRVDPLRSKRGVVNPSDADRAAPRLRLRPAVENAMMGEIGGMGDAPSVSHDLAERLATAAWELARRYQGALETLQRQDAELAATATPIDLGDTANPLADHLQYFLQQAMAATGCEAAALYLLDNDTTSLKIRACAGLPASRLIAPQRSLRGSRGDLESLVRDVVLIDDLAGLQRGTWSSPEPYAAAIVVRVEADDLPIGTLWLWSATPRAFSVGDGAAARLAAAGIASELARSKLSRERHRWTQSGNCIQSAAQWQMRQLPPAMELARGYFVDGWTESPRPWACSWHAWEILPDGTLSLALAEAESAELCGAMIAATARAAFAAHSHYRHNVTDMLSRVSDSLWQTNTGDQIVSMLYAHVNPENGEGRIASAGTIQAIITGGRGFRPLCSGTQSDPLASRIDCRLAQTEFRLQPGEALVAVNRGVLDLQTGLDQSQWADVVRQAVSREDCPVLPAIRRALADKPLQQERAGAMLFRQP